MLHSRWRRATMAAVASLCASAAIVSAADAAQGDLPRLAQSAPTGISMNFWDDHSLSGDSHLGWDHGSSQKEPLAISFQSHLDNTGPGVLQLCAGASGTEWRSARQTAPATLGDCSGTSVNTGSPWFRYAIANHSSGADFNRWHLMDLQRFALVPVTADGQNADTSRATIWDNQWGTCLLDDGGMACPLTANEDAFGVGISAGVTNKLTQEGAPDQALIAFHDLELVSSGRYQVVAMSNPYGAIRESGTTSGSVNCTNVQLTVDQGAGTFALTENPGAPARCFLPRTIQSALTGPGVGAVDPFMGAAADAPCVLHTAAEVVGPDDRPGHCWLTIPTVDDGTHPTARSNVNDARSAVATDAIAVAPGSAIRSSAGGGNSGGNGGGGTGVVTTPRTTTSVPSTGMTITVVPRALPVPALAARKARSYTRTALRTTFGTLPSSAKVTCRMTGGSAAACSASWHRAGGVAYTANVNVWFTSTSTRVSWNYQLKAKRMKHGRVTTINRGTRLGGAVS
jgi:hypothetical protein